MSPPLDLRAAALLKLLVERYVQDGQPVGSRTLSRVTGQRLSPATIRNVMADLDEQGFVSSPHTSAGRIPTARGYRYFVDALLAPEPLSAPERHSILEELGVGQERAAADLVQSASMLLSRLSTMAGVVTVPRRNLSTLRRIEFLPLSERRVLAILVVNHSEVQNRVIQVERDYSAAELERCASEINERFAGMDLPGLRRALQRDARDMQLAVNRMLSHTAVLMEKALTGAGEGADYVLAGGTNLMGFQELADVKRLRELFDVLDRKRDLLSLFEQCLSATGVQIFIGAESGYQVLDECSVVTAPYYVEGEVAGVLGVIGPIRMAYDHIVPLVEETASALGAGLKAKR
ncbi:MAG: heat-inducible transcription repressor HrcA [Nevskiaceae bacterium]|nr:MAG: heat-inducible transcription repressor HrcA [Nevskiaceae bacterium]TBR71536.1 MAG: heat-inducible transcription repressor HrcA [Nevskiaceae bacterium]